MNKWMDFSNEYTQVMKGNFEAMTKFWQASMDQTEGFTSKNMEMFFNHMNTNVEFMHETWTNTISNNNELKKTFSKNIEKFNDKYQKVYEEATKAFTPKEKEAGK